MTEKLLPCPFCGGEAELFHDDFGKIGVHCDECDLWMGVSLEDGVELMDGWHAEFETKEQAITTWNRRADHSSDTNGMMWISVKDRLPRNGTPVLVCYLSFINNKPYTDGVACHRDCGWYWSLDESTVIVEITHWMPLPEPPKEETE